MLGSEGYSKRAREKKRLGDKNEFAKRGLSSLMSSIERKCLSFSEDYRILPIQLSPGLKPRLQLSKTPTAQYFVKHTPCESVATCLHEPTYEVVAIACYLELVRRMLSYRYDLDLTLVFPRILLLANISG